MFSTYWLRFSRSENGLCPTSSAGTRTSTPAIKPLSSGLPWARQDSVPLFVDGPWNIRPPERPTTNVGGILRRVSEGVNRVSSIVTSSYKDQAAVGPEEPSSSPARTTMASLTSPAWLRKDVNTQPDSPERHHVFAICCSPFCIGQRCGMQRWRRTVPSGVADRAADLAPNLTVLRGPALVGMTPSEIAKSLLHKS